MRPFGNPYCLLYADSLENIVQHVQCHLQSRWQKTLDQKSQSCGEITLYQWDSLSLPPRVSPCWWSCWHLNATLENSMLCFQTSRKGSPRTGTVWIRTVCFECLRAVRCTRTQCYWKLIGSLRHETHHWFRIRNHTFLYSSFFFRHLFHLVFRVVTCTDNGCWRTHDVKQSEKMIPLFTGEFAYCQHVWELVFGVNIFYFLNSKLILSNNQSSATLWVRDTCLTVGLLPLIIILITASSSSQM